MNTYEKSIDAMNELMGTMQSFKLALESNDTKAVYETLAGFGASICNEESYAAPVLSRSVLDALIEYHAMSKGTFDMANGNLVLLLSYRKLLNFFILTNKDIVELFSGENSETIVDFINSGYPLDHHTFLELTREYAKMGGYAFHFSRKSQNLLQTMPKAVMVKIAEIFTEKRDIGWLDVDLYQGIDVQVTA